MINGRVTALREESGHTHLFPRIVVGIAGGNRVFRDAEATVDTGFTGWLTLPASIITELGLTHYGQRRATLASGQASMFHLYGALVDWHGQPRPVVVHQSEGAPLVGMAMLEGSRLTVEAWAGGNVTIAESRP